MDFSVNSWRALKAAKQLLNKSRGDHLVVFTVPIVALPSVFDDMPFLPPDTVREAKDKAEKQLEAVRIYLSDISGQFSTEISEPATDAREIVLVSDLLVQTKNNSVIIYMLLINFLWFILLMSVFYSDSVRTKI